MEQHHANEFAYTVSQPDLLAAPALDDGYEFERAKSDSYLVHSPEVHSPRAPPPSTTISSLGQNSSVLMRRHSTTRNLIHRYNSLDTAAHFTPSSSGIPLRLGLGLTPGATSAPPPTSISMALASPLSVTDTSLLPVLKTSYSETQFAERNPLRSSVKNFFGALGWPKREPTFKAIRYRPRDVIPETDSEHSVTLSSPVEIAPILDDSASSAPSPPYELPAPTPAERPRDAALLLLPYDEAPRKAGLLQYLQKDSSWSPSLVTLTTTKLRVEPQMEGRGSSVELPLSQCVDARSLSSKEAQELLISAPFPEGEIPYLLELEFQHNTLQRFAIQSITERGAWVCSLWDGILASRNVTGASRIALSKQLVNPYSSVNSEVNSSPELTYKQSLGNLRIMNALSSAGEDSSTTEAIEKSLPLPPASEISLPPELFSEKGSVHTALRQLHASSVYVSVPSSSASSSRSEYRQSSFDKPSMSLIQERLAGLTGARHAYGSSHSGASLDSQSTVVPASTISPESSVSRQYSITRKIRALDHLEEKTRLQRGGSISSSTDFQLRLSELENTSSIASQEALLQRTRTNHSLATIWSRESVPDLHRVAREVCGPLEHEVTSAYGTATSNEATGSFDYPKSRTVPSFSDDTNLTTPTQSLAQAIDVSVVSESPRLRTREYREDIPLPVGRVDSDLLVLNVPIPKKPLNEDDLSSFSGYWSDDLARKIEGLKAYLNQAKLNQFHFEIDHLVSLIGHPGSKMLSQKALEPTSSAPEVNVPRNVASINIAEEIPSSAHEVYDHAFQHPATQANPKVNVIRNLTIPEPETASKALELLNRVEALLSQREADTVPEEQAQTLHLQPIIEKIESLFASSWLGASTLPDIPLASPLKEAHKLADIPRSQEKDSDVTNTPLSEKSDVPKLSDNSSSGPQCSLAELCEKIDALSAACLRSTRNGSNSFMTDSLWDGQQQMLGKAEEISKVLKVEQEKSSALEKQTAESSKYLNELNKWLETVVKNGGNSIQTMAAGIDLLTNEIFGAPPSQEGEADVQSEAPSHQGLAQEIRQFMKDRRDQEEELNGLHDAIKGLVQQIRDEAVERSPEVLLEKQRTSFEGIVKEFAAQLSMEIRGEQSRFVDAMQQATTFHVNQQVEEFRATMSAEVSKMTQDVLRLQRERQVVEHQLSELFALLSKQKQIVLVNQHSWGNQANVMAQHVSARQLPGGLSPHPTVVGRTGPQK